MGYTSAVIVYLISWLAIAVLVLITSVAPWFRRAIEGEIDSSAFFFVLTSPGPVAACVAAYLVATRWWRSRQEGVDLLPPGFCHAKRAGYLFGLGLVWLGHLLLVGMVGATIYFLIDPSPEGMFAGIGIAVGLALFLYMVGILFVEISFRRWSPDRDPDNPARAEP
jgi:hypothetical protein